MPSTFTIRNTGDTQLEVQRKGEQGRSGGGDVPPVAQPRGKGQGQGQGGQGQGGQGQGGGQDETREADLRPGEERTFTVDKNSHVQVREGESPEAQPKR
jgi:hypothetical protein